MFHFLYNYNSLVALSGKLLVIVIVIAIVIVIVIVIGHHSNRFDCLLQQLNLQLQNLQYTSTVQSVNSMVVFIVKKMKPIPEIAVQNPVVAPARC